VTLRILLLAGTAEARAIADALFDMRDVWAVASMAGATRQPEPLALPCRIGGFGGEEGFATYLRSQRIDAVIDATHPFAARISARTAAVCDALGLPRLLVLRPEWTPRPGDRWVHVACEAEVAAHIPRGATVFLATGRQTLMRFANLEGRRLICRRMEPPEAPFPIPGGTYLVGRPPFSVPGERALFRRLGVDWVVTKNSGGQASRAKLDAARQMAVDRGRLERALVRDLVDANPGA